MIGEPTDAPDRNGRSGISVKSTSLAPIPAGDLRRSPSTTSAQNIACVMPQLAWNDVDFLDFFAVEPTVEDYAVSHNYEIDRDGLRLLFTVWQLESVIQASLFRETTEDALFTFTAYVRGEARFLDDKRGRYLEIEDCIVAPSRFWYIQSGDPFNRERFPVSVTVTVTVDPDIRIAFVNFEPRT